jgi:uncharacterized protein with HEPN domain
MSERNTVLLLEDILQAIDKVLSYTQGMTFDEYMNDTKTVDAVVRNFSIIGEAANKIPAEFKSAHPEIEWQRIRGFRNRIVHEYFDIDHELVWQIKEENLPELKKKLAILLSTL